MLIQLKLLNVYISKAQQQATTTSNNSERLATRDGTNNKMS